MRLRCPCCGASNSLDALVSHDAARAAIKAALELDAGLGGLVYQYLGLFRPAKNALGWDKVASVLHELNPMIASAQIQRDGQSYPAPREVWKAALATVLATRSTLTLPLKTHGYLLGIIVNNHKQQNKQLENKRDMARSGNTPVAAGAATRPEMTCLPELPPRQGAPKEFTNLVKALKKRSTDVFTQSTQTGNAAAKDTPDPATP
ncbi:MAG: GAF domain-containing protein [Oxalobacteraceae bacterium]|nr:GAF domain-containing protein [Oxalobacteraceae bacterium]